MINGPEAYEEDWARSALRERCEQQAAALVEPVLALTHLPMEKRIEPLLLLVELAATRGDAGAAKTWGDRLQTVQGDCRPQAIMAYYAGYLLGDEYCSTRFFELLGNEQAEARILLPGHPIDLSTYNDLAPGLRMVVQKCATRRQTVDPWIEKSIDTAHTWTLWQAYAEAAGQHDVADDARRHMMDMVLDDSLDEADFVAKATTQVLKVATDADTKQRLLEKYKALEPKRTLRIGTLQDVANCGSFMIFDEDVGSDATAAWFETTVSWYEQKLLETGRSSYFVPIASLLWRMALSWRKDTNPYELIAIGDNLVYNLNSLPDESPAPSSLPVVTTGDVLMTRDYALKTFALRMASAGDFRNSAKLVKALAIDDMREVAVKECLAHAHTPGNMAAYFPSPDEAPFMRNLTTHIRAALLRMEDNVEHIGAYIDNLLDRIITSQDVRRPFLERTLQALVATIYEHNAGAANALTERITQRLDATQKSNLSLKLAGIQIERNPDFLLRQQFFEKIAGLQDPYLQIHHLIHLAENM